VVVLKVRGDDLQMKAKLTLTGIIGEAKGCSRSFRVYSKKSVLKLKPGRYSVSAKKVRSSGEVAVEDVSPISASVYHVERV
jgi:hypothetical protein